MSYPEPKCLNPSAPWDLFALMSGVSNRLGCPTIAVGGIADHVHILAHFSRTIPTTEWVKEIKRISSLQTKDRISDFAWQAGYGVVAVQTESIDSVAAYIRGQEEHHRRESFQDELRRIMAQ